MGCIFQNSWAQMSLLKDKFLPNIIVLELFVIVIAVEIRAGKIAGQTVLLCSDNQATIA